MAANMKKAAGNPGDPEICSGFWGWRRSIAITTVAGPLVAAPATATIASPTASVAAASVTSPTATSLVAAAISPVAATAAETAPATTTKTATAAGGPLLARTGDVHGQGSAVQFLAVEQFNRLLGFFGTAELYKCEAAGTARELVEHQVDVDHHARGAEVVLEIAFEGLKRQVSYE